MLLTAPSTQILPSQDAPPACAGGLDEPRFKRETGLAARVAEAAEPALKGLGYRLVRVKISAQAGMTVQIMAERPDGAMTIEDCERASQNLSPVLDVADPVSQAYRLEISSPGIDRPLVRASDMARAVGHEIRVESSNPGPCGRKRFRGFIRGLVGDRLLLERSDAVEGEETRVEILLKEIDDARLILTDALTRASLRAGKQEIADAKKEDASADAPRRGPGRFSVKGGEGRLRGKEKPLTPAGVQTAFKRNPSPQPRIKPKI